MSDTPEMEDKSEVSTDISGGRDLKIEETEFVDTNFNLELMENSDRFVHQYQSDAQDQHPQEAQWELPMSSERLQGNHARPYEAARGCQARELQGNKKSILKFLSYEIN